MVSGQVSTGEDTVVRAGNARIVLPWEAVQEAAAHAIFTRFGALVDPRKIRVVVEEGRPIEFWYEG